MPNNDNSSLAIQDRVGLPTASNYQIDFFHGVERAMNQMLDGEVAQSLIVDAKPGSGKTTTGVAATRLIPDAFSAIFVAFGKKIADELATRLPRGIPGKTFHSHWKRQWDRYCKTRLGHWPEVNPYKVSDQVRAHFGLNQKHAKRMSAAEREDRKRIEDLASNVRFLVEKAKLFGVVPEGYPNGDSITGMKDERAFWEHLSDFFDQQIEPDELDETIRVARELLWQGLENEMEIDYADMCYMPAVKGVTSEKFMVVMVDECQDLSELEHFLLERMLDPMGTLIAIGDRRQSIYGFRGADTDSIDHLKHRFNCTEYPLSISYRCAQKIVDYAYSIYPEIEARPNAPEGSVEYPFKLDIDDFKPGELVVCRNNAPVLDLAYRLIRNRTPAKVVGRDIGNGLTKLIRRLDEDDTIPTMLVGLNQWKERQYAVAERKKNHERAKQQIDDKYECIRSLAQAVEIKSVTELLATIDMMFLESDQSPIISSSRVTLSTIHKIKGAECDTVYVLDPQLINAPWMRGGDWQEIQEENLRFVAVTRAKNRLVMIKSDQIES